MKHSETAHTHAHSHTHKDCACDHEHEQGHEHDHSHDDHPLSFTRRWIFSVLIVVVLLVLLRPFIIDQMIVRETSYAGNSSYHNAIRISRKIIALDPGNTRAWTSLGYVYMDEGQTGHAIGAFEKILSLNPQDKGAASFELGQAYYNEGNYPKAIENFERVLSAGPRASVLLEADILKYRHGTLGFRSLNSMQTLLKELMGSYQQTDNAAKAAEVQKEYEFYKNNHSRVLF